MTSQQQPGQAADTTRSDTTECPFCKRVLAGDYGVSDRYSVSFEPLNPVTPGHLLVLPKTHVSDALIDPELTGFVMEFAACIAADRGGPCNLITSVGATATQTVRHLHIHIVPRRLDDGLHLPWTGQVPAAGRDIAGVPAGTPARNSPGHGNGDQ